MYSKGVEWAVKTFDPYKAPGPALRRLRLDAARLLRPRTGDRNKRVCVRKRVWAYSSNKMLNTFYSLKSFVNISGVKISGTVFHMNCVLTSIILILCFIMVTAGQYFNDSINCIFYKDLPKDVINTYSLVGGTYTSFPADKKEMSETFLDDSKTRSDNVKKHTYY